MAQQVKTKFMKVDLQKYDQAYLDAAIVSIKQQLSDKGITLNQDPTFQVPKIRREFIKKTPEVTDGTLLHKQESTTRMVPSNYTVCLLTGTRAGQEESTLGVAKRARRDYNNVFYGKYLALDRAVSNLMELFPIEEEEDNGTQGNE